MLDVKGEQPRAKPMLDQRAIWAVISLISRVRSPPPIDRLGLGDTHRDRLRD